MSFPPDVVAFVKAHVHSVEQLRALLLLRDSQPKAWSARELCFAMRTSFESAAARLEDLHASGFADVINEGELRYRYNGASTELLSEVQRLLESHRVAMIQLIYSRAP